MKNSDLEPPVQFWCELWVEFAVISVTMVAAGSAFGHMRAGAWLALVVGGLWGSLAVYRKRGDIIRAFKTWPATIRLLAFLTLISLLIRPHSFLDSYSYRIPQLLLWLQEGRPWSVPFVDMRINMIPHTWSFLSSVFFLPFGERGLALPNWFSYLLLIGIFSHMLSTIPSLSTQRKWHIALIFLSTPVLVMQASSNDNTIACAALLMTSMFFALYLPPSTRTALYSGLAFALAIGIKPQYSTLAPLWAIWFFWGPGKPFRALNWRVAIIAFPLIVLSSPLPTFFINHFHHGSISHPQVGETLLASEYNQEEDLASETATTFTQRQLHSYVSLTIQLLALPFNPAAQVLTTWMHKSFPAIPVLRLVDWPRYRIYPILIAENASLSLIASLALLVGLLRCRKTRPEFSGVGLGSIIAMVLAIGLTSPTTLGRSFVGFFLLLLPLSFHGLATLPKPILNSAAMLSLAMGVLTIIFNPAAPMWPSETVLASSFGDRLPAMAHNYPLYARRIHAGTTLIAQIPHDEQHLGVIVQENRPIASLWQPYNRRRTVHFFPPNAALADLRDHAVSYLIIRHPALISDHQLCPDFVDSLNATVLDQEMHTSFLQVGRESWFLIHIPPAQD